MITPAPSCFGLNFFGYNTKVLDEYLLRDSFDHIATVNAEFIVTAYEEKDHRFLKVINNSICTVDGQIPLWISKVFGKNTKSLVKISGSDYSKHVLTLARNNNLKVFFLGGNPVSIEKLLEEYPENHLFGGYSPEFEKYPFSLANTLSIQDKLNKFNPDIVLVGFGAVKQEYWIDDNKQFLNELGVRCAIGVGGTFEFLAGTFSRAPIFIQKAGLESIYRLAQQPSLFRMKRILKSLKVIKHVYKKTPA